MLTDKISIDQPWTMFLVCWYMCYKLWGHKLQGIENCITYFHIINVKAISSNKLFFFYKNKVYKNTEPDVLDETKNIFEAKN